MGSLHDPANLAPGDRRRPALDGSMHGGQTGIAVVEPQRPVPIHEAADQMPSRPARELAVVETVEELPPLYARWITGILGGPIPREVRSTCDHCAMVGPHDPASGVPAFDSAMKCCSYQPSLPNYLAGGILSDASLSGSSGLESVENRITGGVDVSPLQIGVPPSYRMFYDATAPWGFGRTTTLRCPHLTEAGTCGIWQHRNGVCATWFCKYSRGATAGAFWNSINYLLRTIENDLTVWCCLELGIDPSAILTVVDNRPRSGGDRLHEELLPGVAAAKSRELWGAWHDRKEEFYRECARLVREFSADDVLARCGPEARARARQAQVEYQRLMSTDVPSRLQFRGAQLGIVALSSETLELHTFSKLDPVEISVSVYTALTHFDGRPTVDVLEEVRPLVAGVLDDALLRTLVDYRVLHPVDSPENRSG